MGRIAQNVLEDILGRVDIVELIAGYIPLKRAGRNFKALCPFHHEKSSSFMVSPDRQIFHCFGCGESGNAFKFLMRYERMEFPEAVEVLAQKAGVRLPEFQKEDSAVSSLITELYKINEAGSLFYHGNLNSAAGQQARQYLVKRGIKVETAVLFKLGLALETWDGIITHLRGKGFALAALEKAGLILPRDSGGYYDRFRNRIIFPIRDIKSRVLGFGARVLDNSLPKYVNSPETPIYTKGRNLFGLDLSKDAIRDSDCAVIVEGYLDFIIPYQAGIKNIVASSGTALTQEQAKLIKRYTHNVVVVFDPDSAGEMAALRSLDIFIEEEMSVKVATLPQSFDPDLFVRKSGPEAFKEKIDSAQSLFDYKLKVLKSRFNSAEIEDKAKIAGLMLLTINKINDSVLKSEYTKKLAQELDVKEEALHAEIKKMSKAAPSARNADTVYPKAVPASPVEKLLIKLMLEQTELIHRVKDHLSPADFADARVGRIIQAALELAQKGSAIEPSFLMDHIGQEDISRLICESVFLPEELSGQDREKLFDDCLSRLKQEKVRTKQLRLHEEIKTAQGAGDQEKLRTLLEEFHLLVKKP